MTASASFWRLIQKQVSLETRWTSLEDKLSSVNTRSQCQRSKVSSSWPPDNLKIPWPWCCVGLPPFILLRPSSELPQLLTYSLYPFTLVWCLSVSSQVSVTGRKKDNSCNLGKKSTIKGFKSTEVLMVPFKKSQLPNSLSEILSIFNKVTESQLIASWLKRWTSPLIISSTTQIQILLRRSKVKNMMKLPMIDQTTMVKTPMPFCSLTVKLWLVKVKPLFVLLEKTLFYIESWKEKRWNPKTVKLI